MARVSERQRNKAAHIEQSLAAAAERRSAFLQLDSTRMAAMHAAAAARRAGKDAEWQRAAAALTQRLEQVLHGYQHHVKSVMLFHGCMTACRRVPTLHTMPPGCAGQTYGHTHWQNIVPEQLGNTDLPHCMQAAAARQAQLAAAAARMAEQGAQAKAIARQVRASKQARLQAKAAALQQRQERASQTRHEIVQAFVHSLPHAGGGSWQLRSGGLHCLNCVSLAYLGSAAGAAPSGGWPSAGAAACVFA